MKFGKFKIRILLIATILLCLALNTEAQTVYTNTGKAKYIKTTVDTFSIPGVTGAYRQGMVTNQTSSKQLTIYFSKEDGSKDTSSRVIVDGGKTLKFRFKGTKIFRVQTSSTAADSVYSQVIIGDVQLNYNGPGENSRYEYTIYHFDNEFLKPERLRCSEPIVTAS